MKMISKSVLRLNLLCTFLTLVCAVWGYSFGIMPSILVNPGFRQVLGYPTPAQTGVIVAAHFVGTWSGYIFIGHSVSDRFGRRYAALLGILAIAVAMGLQAGASGPGAYAMMIAGRIISGVGSVSPSAITLYLSEIAPADTRGRYIMMHHLGLCAGISIGLWTGYGMSFSNNSDDISWRSSLAIIIVPCIIFGIGLPFLPESPRWLVEKGHHDQALRTLSRLREESFTNEEIHLELSRIRDDVDEYRSLGSSWLALIRDPNLFSRLWRAFLLHFMAQMCGATTMNLYMPTLLQNLGLSRRVALMIGASLFTFKTGIVMTELLIIDRFGRRVMLISGSIIMSFALFIISLLGQLYPGTTNRAADITCVVFILIYSFGDDMGFGSTTWVYGSEIFPTSFRARGANIAASGNPVGAVLTSQLWPVGVAAMGSGIYFVFMAINVACIPILFLFYPETKGLALEDMDVLFGKPMQPGEEDARE